MLISDYKEGNRFAQVFSRTNGGYRIVLHDVYLEIQDEKYSDSLSTAEDIAENWVLKC